MRAIRSALARPASRRPRRSLAPRHGPRHRRRPGRRRAGSARGRRRSQHGRDGDRRAAEQRRSCSVTGRGRRPGRRVVHRPLPGRDGLGGWLLRPRLGTSPPPPPGRPPAPCGAREPRRRRRHVARMTQFGPDAPPIWWITSWGSPARAPSEVWTDGLAELMEMDLRHALPRVRVPALVIVGQHDRMTPPAAAVGAGRALPDAALVVIEGAGHIAMLERPAERESDIRAFAGAPVIPRERNEAPGTARGARHMTPDPRRRRPPRPPPARGAARRGPDPGGVRRGRPRRGPAVHRRGAGVPRGQAGRAVRGRGGPAADADAGRDRSRTRGRLHRERPQVPAARQPRSVPDEIEACTPWLVEQISPDPAARRSSRSATSRRSSCCRPRAASRRCGARCTPWHGRRVIPTFHPAAILHGGGETVAGSSRTSGPTSR